MRTAPVLFGVCAGLICGCAAKPSAPPSQTAAIATTSTPLILEKNEGERRVVRGWPEHPDPGESIPSLKVDPKNGGSSHLVFMTADIAPGGAIHPHQHPHADEILYLETGTARVHLGRLGRRVHAGATVFIPAAPGSLLEEHGERPYQHAGHLFRARLRRIHARGSVREGEKNVPAHRGRERSTREGTSGGCDLQGT